MNRLVALVFATLSVIAANAQQTSFSREVIAAGGDFFISSAGSLSWTLGETVIETFENNSINIILTQGFQQPDEFVKNDTTGIWELPSSNTLLKLYPNPTAHFVKLELKHDADSKLKIELVDMLGRVINTDHFEAGKGQVSNYQLDVSSLSAGMYMFRLTGNGQILNSYKFQKVSY